MPARLSHYRPLICIANRTQLVQHVFLCFGEEMLKKGRPCSDGEGDNGNPQEVLGLAAEQVADFLEDISAGTHSIAYILIADNMPVQSQ